MSESQVITKLTPSIKVSTLDGHRIVKGNGPAAQPRNEPLSGGQPRQAPNADLVIKHRQSIEATMSGGGVQVKHPPQHHIDQRTPNAGAVSRRIPMTQAAPQAQRGRAVVTHPASTFSKAEIEFIGALVAPIADKAGGSQLELAQSTLQKLIELHASAK